MRTRRRGDLRWVAVAGVLTVLTATVFPVGAAALLIMTTVLSVRCWSGVHAARSWVAAVLLVVTLVVSGLPIAMIGLSRLPAERQFQECSEQADVSQCHDPLTSWLP